MAVEAGNRVQLAASHWKPRFVANGVDVNDFEAVLAETSEWKNWAPAWQRVGDLHRALAEEALRAGHRETATAAFQRGNSRWAKGVG